MAIEGISSVSGSSVGSLLFQALAASGAFSVSQATQNRLTNLQNLQASSATRLSDLAELRSLLVDLSSAAAAVRPAPTTTGSDIEVDKIDGDAADEHLELDLTDAAALQTGDKIRFDTTGNGITSGTTYFVRVINTDANSKDIRLYTTREDALNDTNAVNLTTNNNPSVLGNQIIPQPESNIEALFDAYNQLQDYLAEKTKAGGSLADERLLSQLGSKLLAAVRPALKSSDFAPAVSFNGTSRELTIDSDTLASQVDASAQSIASLFDDNADLVSGSVVDVNVAEGLRQVADSYTSVIDTLASTLDQQAPALSTQISDLLQRSQDEQAAGFSNIGKIAGAISLTQLRIQFLSTLA